MQLCSLSDSLDELLARTMGAAGVLDALREMSANPGWRIPDRIVDVIYASVVYLDGLADYVNTIREQVEEARAEEHDARN